MTKKIVALALAAIMALSMTACGSKEEETKAPETTTAAAAETTAANAETTAADADPYADLDPATLIIASSASSSLATHTMMQELADAISEKTGGKLTIELNWDGILGDDSALVENTIGGTIPMFSMMTSPLLNYIPEIGVFDCPAVFGDAAAAQAGVAAMADSFAPLFEAQGLKILGMGLQGFRALSFSGDPITTPEGFQGLSIRTMENKYHMGFWENMGATPTPLAFSDLYLSLQQGLVDGQDNAAAAVYSNKFYEVQDYYMKLPVFMNVPVIIINKGVYDGLPAEYQVLLDQFGQDYVARAYEAESATVDEALAKMEGELEVLDVTPEMVAAFQEAAKPIWDEIAEALGAEIVDAYLAQGGVSR